MSYLKVIIKTVIITLIFYLILLIISNENYSKKIEPLHIFIALIPFIILLIVSGKLKEISGPGGIGLSLIEEVQKPIFLELIEMPLEVGPESVGLKELEDDIRYEEYTDQNHPTTLSFELLKKNYYDERAIRGYISILERYPDFRYVIFIDTYGKFMGCIRINDFKVLLEIGSIVQKLENGQILRDLRVIADSIKMGSTNKQALIEMEKINSNMLPVVDNKGKFIGIVTIYTIIRKILLKMISDA